MTTLKPKLAAMFIAFILLVAHNLVAQPLRFANEAIKIDIFSTQKPVEIGTAFTMRGFRVEILTVNEQAPFSGTGLLQVPFVDSLIQVRFSGLELNALNEAIQGQVYSDKNQSGLGLVWGDAINIGSPFSVKKKNDVVDENGFDENEKYNQTAHYIGFQDGFPIDSTYQYDPCGFDKDGNHKDTGEFTNPDGCTREDVKRNIATCTDCYSTPNAYNWIGASGVGAVFYQKNKDSIPSWTHKAFNQLISTNKDTLASIRKLCESKRTSILALIKKLNYDTIFIFGENGVYFRESLSNRFAAKPRPMQLEGANRNPLTAALEKQNIELFEYDLKLEKYKKIDTLLQKMNASNEFKNALTRVVYKIKDFSKEDIEQCKNKSALNSKIKILLDDFLKYDISKIKPRFSYIETPIFKNDAQYLPTNLLKNSTQSAFSNVNVSSFLLYNKIPFLSFIHFFNKNKNTDFQTLVDSIPATKKPIAYMPIAKHRFINGKTYSVYFDSLSITPSAAVVSVFAEIPMPNQAIPIIFVAKSINFDINGFVTTGGENPKIYLNSNIEIAISNSMSLVLEGSSSNKNGTFVTFNRNGFVGMGIEGNLEISRNYLIPLDSAMQNELPKPQSVRARISNVLLSNWDDFMLYNLPIQPFVVNGIAQLKWRAESINLDLSATKRIRNIQYPKSYKKLTANMPNNITTVGWKGFYIEKFSVIMPNGIGNIKNLPDTVGAKAPKPLAIEAKDFVFDNTGFTGEINEKNVLSLDDGTLGGWAFSMDNINVRVQSNRLLAANFSGLVNVPLFKESAGKDIKRNDCFAYSAFAIGQKFQFNIETPEKAMSATAWKAKILLEKTSYITISYDEYSKKIIALAKLNGKMSIDANSTDSRIGLPEISFQNLIISNKMPYVQNLEYCSLPTNASAQFGGFDLEINEFDRTSYGAKNVGIRLYSSVKLAPGDGLNITAKGQFCLNATVIPTHHQYWEFEKTEAKEVFVNTTFKENRILGQLYFFDADPVATQWGRGFRGYPNTKFAGINAPMQALAQFGKTNGSNAYNYFMVDAKVNNTYGIPITKGLQLKGFGGGISYHLERANANLGLDTSVTTIDSTKFGALGVSLSKTTYAPNAQIGLKVNAILALTTVSEGAFSSHLNLDVAMNDATKGGGISEIALLGNSRFMSDFNIKNLPNFDASKSISNVAETTSQLPTNDTPFNDAPISANTEIKYNFNKKTFDGNLQANFLAANGTLTGAGQGVFHFDANDWYVNLGTPDQRIELITKVKKSENAYSDVVLNAYLDIGTAIPKKPNLPLNVSTIAGPNSFNQNEIGRATGSGFAFGASTKLNMSFKEKKIYTSLNTELDFDVMLQNYAKKTNCSNTGQPLGINGWYASGETSTYAAGNVGITYKNTKLPLFSLATAAPLQVNFPNPVFAKGEIEMQYNILGGSIKGDTKVTFEHGEACDTNTSSKQLQVIEDIKSQQNVDVMTAFKINFNTPIGSEFYDDKGNTFYTRFERCTMTSLKTGYETYTILYWNEDHTSLTIKPNSMLYHGDSLELRMIVSISKNRGVGVYVEKRAYFTVAPNYEYIPNDNVAFSYPLAGQYNYYKEQIISEKGYIQLKYHQSDLFANSKRKTLRVRYKTKYTEYVVQDAKYDYANARVEFDLPPATLQNEKVYYFELVFSNKEEAAYENERNPNAVFVEKFDAKPIYKMYFRVSRYNTFGAKIADLKQFSAHSQSDEVLKLNFSAAAEPFDRFELFGTENTKPLVELSSNYENTDLYQKLKGFIYENKNLPSYYRFNNACLNVGLNGGSIVFDNYSKDDQLKKAVLLTQPQMTKPIEISPEDFYNFKPTNGSSQYIHYYANELMVKDWKKVSKQVVTVLDNHNYCVYAVNPNKSYNNNYPYYGIETWQNRLYEMRKNPENMNLKAASGDYKIQITYRCTRLDKGQPDSVQEITLKKQ